MKEYIVRIEDTDSDFDEMFIGGIRKVYPELIRCKYCKYYRTIHCRMDIHHEEITIYRVIPNGHCNFGERKEE